MCTQVNIGTHTHKKTHTHTHTQHKYSTLIGRIARFMLMTWKIKPFLMQIQVTHTNM